MLGIPSSKLDIIIVLGIIFLLVVMLYNNRKSISIFNKDSAELGVQDLIEKVKDELIKTEQKRIKDGRDPLFELKDFELEINFVVTNRNKESGGFDFKVVTLEGERDISSERIQKVKLRMAAIPPQEHQAEASEVPLEIDDSTVIRGAQPPEKK